MPLLIISIIYHSHIMVSEALLKIEDLSCCNKNQVDQYLVHLKVAA